MWPNSVVTSGGHSETHVSNEEVNGRDATQNSAEPTRNSDRNSAAKADVPVEAVEDEAVRTLVFPAVDLPPARAFNCASHVALLHAGNPTHATSSNSA